MSSRMDGFVGDQNATRQDPERPLENAHILIEYQVRNVGGLQQRLDRRKENRIVGANKFAHGAFPGVATVRGFPSHMYTSAIAPNA